MINPDINPQFLHEIRWLSPFAEISHRWLLHLQIEPSRTEHLAGKRPRSENPLGKTSRKTTWWLTYPSEKYMVNIWLLILWLVVDQPLWKIWVRQLGLWHSQYGKMKNVPNHQPAIYIMHPAHIEYAFFRLCSWTRTKLHLEYAPISCLFVFSPFELSTYHPYCNTNGHIWTFFNFSPQ